MFTDENYFNRTKSYPEFIHKKPSLNTNLIIVIPCYKDEFIFKTLDSVCSNTNFNFYVEIIVVVNYSINDDNINKQINKNIYNRLKNYRSSNSKIIIHSIIIENVSKKHSGVGNARKAGMDEAVRRFKKINNPEGIIVSLDADCLVDKSYLQEIESSFNYNQNQGGCIIQYSHNFDCSEYDKKIITAAKYYEIYLRYFRLGLKLTGFPYPYHTIGSCFAVKSDIYLKCGGMSKRQGGEDFYFIHKIAPITKIGLINKKLVFPSPRISDRVPFGTGPEIKKIIDNNYTYNVYNFNSFLVLKNFFDSFNQLFDKEEIMFSKYSEIIIHYCGKQKIKEIITECKSNTKTLKSFNKRMFTNFNAFFIVKFLNSLNKNSKYLPKNILISSNELFNYYGLNIEKNELDNILTKITNLDLSL